MAVHIKTLLPYITVILPTFIAAGQVIFKDWNSYRPRSTRWVLLSTIVVAGTWGLFYQHQQIGDREDKENQAKTDKIAGEARVKAAEKAQADNTALYLRSFDTLSKKISDLRTKVATKELEDQLAKTQTELEKTRKALTPPSPVKLLWSLKPFNVYAERPDLTPVTSIALPLDDEGVVKVPIYIYNADSRPALQGDITVQVCDACKYSGEPEHFKKIRGDLETRRMFAFDHVNSLTQVTDIVLPIKPPDGAARMTLGIIVKCTTCQHLERMQFFTVALSRGSR